LHFFFFLFVAGLQCDHVFREMVFLKAPFATESFSNKKRFCLLSSRWLFESSHLWKSILELGSRSSEILSVKKAKKPAFLLW